MARFDDDQIQGISFPEKVRLVIQSQVVNGEGALAINFVLYCQYCR